MARGKDAISRGVLVQIGDAFVTATTLRFLGSLARDAGGGVVEIDIAGPGATRLQGSTAGSTMGSALLVGLGSMVGAAAGATTGSADIFGVGALAGSTAGLTTSAANLTNV